VSEISRGRGVGVSVVAGGESPEKLVLDLLRELGAPVLRVGVRGGEGSGYVLVTLDCGARQAMEYWLELAGRAGRLGVPVFVEWTGSNDLEPEEHGAYVGKALARMGVFLRTREPIDVVAALNEAWGC